jgi:hypothetical protein
MKKMALVLLLAGFALALAPNSLWADGFTFSVDPTRITAQMGVSSSINLNAKYRLNWVNDFPRFSAAGYLVESRNMGNTGFPNIFVSATPFEMGWPGLFTVGPTIADDLSRYDWVANVDNEPMESLDYKIRFPFNFGGTIRAGRYVFFQVTAMKYSLDRVFYREEVVVPYHSEEYRRTTISRGVDFYGTLGLRFSEHGYFGPIFKTAGGHKSFGVAIGMGLF